MSLGEVQRLFTREVARLIQQATAMGYELTFGDAYRDPRVFGQQFQAMGYGRAVSAHKQRLAIDLNLFKDGKYLADTESHRPLGEWWVSQGPRHCWGGAFEDGNHYSFDFNGAK
jgi:hypothetical protein